MPSQVDTGDTYALKALSGLAPPKGPRHGWDSPSCLLVVVTMASRQTFYADLLAHTDLTSCLLQYRNMVAVPQHGSCMPAPVHPTEVVMIAVQLRQGLRSQIWNAD